MNKISIQGKVLPKGTSEIITLTSEYNQIEKSFGLGVVRGKADILDIGAQEDDIIGLEFEDGGEWIGHIDDIQQIFGEHIKLRGSDVVFPIRITPSDGTETERGLAEISIKVLNLIRSKKTFSEAAARLIGRKADEKMMEAPGLYKVANNGALTGAKFDQKPGKYLLFIHGTLSSFDGSFGDLYNQDTTGIVTAIREGYKDRVLALQHYTISKSPFDNALELLKELPKGSTLDIISHSRGGLVADILACCDKRNGPTVYSEDDVRLARTSEENLAASLEAINAWAKRKEIVVENVIRIACPGNGTELLNNSLDHFLNGLMRSVGLALGGKANLTYQFIRGFITDVIRARQSPGVMPGLLSMKPESVPQKLINRMAVTVKSQLVVIEGDSEAGRRFWRSVLVVLSNLYYKKANDFVVNTDSMRYGALRESGLYFFQCKDEATSHFNYFKNENSQQAILDALKTPVGQSIKRFEYRSAADRDRGVILDVFKKFKAISTKDISGKKPIVIIIPGVMGTHLSVENKIIWIDLGEIGKGRMVRDLAAQNTEVDTTYIIGDFYAKLVSFLQRDFDVYTLGYDWRRSLRHAAASLDELISDLSNKAPDQPISIVAHSMGGLVVRDMMRLHKTNWSRYISRKDSRTILLGTPWLGSHLIMEVFTGHQSRVRQINLMDTKHSKEELIQVFNQYHGLYDLLPVNDEKFEKESFWSNINADLEKDKIILPPLLQYFKSYKSQVISFNQNPDLKNVFYLAGKDEATTCAYRIRKSIFGRRLQYLGTPEGDGSVTWALGIPRALPAERIYYAHETSHGDLANDENLFDGIRELIIQGKTQNLCSNPPAIPTDRSVVEKDEYRLIRVLPEAIVSNRADEAMLVLQGRKLTPVKKAKPADRYIEVGVVHGDLRIASHPVMVGHFKNDGITNAEAAIDGYFDRKLSERHRISYYPGEVGESLILFDPDKDPKGTLILGLGEINSLTPFHLRKTVEAGIINYAMHFRDNVNDDSGQGSQGHNTRISCLCIGTGYGRLAMEEALNAILSGVQRANQVIESFRDLKPVNTVEIIELFEHIAQNAYYQLSQLEVNNSSNLTFRLTRGIEKKTGARRKFQFSIEYSWWHNFTTRLIKKDDTINIPRIQFTSASGIARVEEENTFTSQKIIHALLEKMAVDQGLWNKEYSKTLFEILVPNAFKEIIRHQNNILWKMDLDTASYPWELFHDYEVDQNPTFVRAGLIRQLYTPGAETKPDIIHNQQALVIADPVYSADGPGQLPGARKEGNAVVQKLRSGGIETHSLIHSEGLEILNNLYNKEFKLLHIAGHGTISNDPNETGIVLENGMYITPGMLKNMSRLPEFVFINCCFSGTVEPGKEKQYQQRYRFAANVGTQLIAMGVSAAVVAGWPVNDDAALLFAETFYDQLLAGKSFGDAVRQAREACWNAFKEGNNTWGAYQCYGDQWYRILPRQNGKQSGPKYFTLDQVLVDLYNLKSETQHYKGKSEALEKKLDLIVSRAREDKFIQGPVLELQAEILSELDQLDKAILAYSDLRKLNISEFTVKALEQYCNLRAKSLLRQAKNKNTRTETIDRDIRILLQDFDYLHLIGETPERLNLSGSAYKKIAMIYADRKATASNKNFVKRMLRSASVHYARSYKLIDPADVQSGVYPLTNWLSLHAILSKEPNIKIHGKEIKIINHLEAIKKSLIHITGRNVDFWKDISLVNILECELFYVGDKKLEGIKNEILQRYPHDWELSGTMRQKQAEMEQLDFLEMGISIIQRPESWKKTRRGVIGDIRKELDILE